MMNNYIDKNSLELFLDNIDKCLINKSFLPALTMALIIPDMLGKLAYPDLEKNKNRYIKWFDDNIRDIVFGHLRSQNPLDVSGDSPKLNGEVCYALRCKLYHEGINDIEEKTPSMHINEFVLSLADEDWVMGDYAGKDYIFSEWDPVTGKVPEVNYLYISCKGLCKEIVEAAKVFVRKNPDLDYPTLRINQGGGKINSDWFVNQIRIKK